MMLDGLIFSVPGANMAGAGVPSGSQKELMLNFSPAAGVAFVMVRLGYVIALPLILLGWPV